jgi:hypothetical protein
MFKIVVRAWEPLHVVTVKKPGPIALGYLQEMLDRPLERAGCGALLAHPFKERLITTFDHLGHLFRTVLQDLGGLLDPAERPPQIGPQGRGGL